MTLNLRWNPWMILLAHDFGRGYFYERFETIILELKNLLS
ncbi:hypothetical protein SAMN05421761_101151 [Belliella pelovolcani]|uniref:Uncharacterized protein n=1 Tax=Belliella pelovolcani TaxID=529505 RepID=A0A1N7JN51_9BACT|nr:hypothetical protein SAMN05421761_101151 [Belliella pelovolcani]